MDEMCVSVMWKYKLSDKTATQRAHEITLMIHSDGLCCDDRIGITQNLGPSKILLAHTRGGELSITFYFHRSLHFLSNDFSSNGGFQAPLCSAQGIDQKGHFCLHLESRGYAITLDVLENTWVQPDVADCWLFDATRRRLCTEPSHKHIAWWRPLLKKAKWLSSAILINCLTDSKW